MIAALLSFFFPRGLAVPDKPVALCLLLALVLLCGAYGLGWRAGAGACQRQQQENGARLVQQSLTVRGAVLAAAARRSGQDNAMSVRNQEEVRNVTRAAQHMADGDDVCIPAALADRLRRIE